MQIKYNKSELTRPCRDEREKASVDVTYQYTDSKETLKMFLSFNIKKKKNEIYRVARVGVEYCPLKFHLYIM